MTGHRSLAPRRSPKQSAELHDLVAARSSGNSEWCRRAEDAVVVAFLPVASSIAHRYRRRGVDFDDLEQVARMGLIKAARRWQPEAGSFLAYAMPTVEGEVKRHFRDRASAIRIPRLLYESQPRVTAAQRALRQETSREPSIAEIADRAGLPAQQVRDVQTAVHACQPHGIDDEHDDTAGVDYPAAEQEFAMVSVRDQLRPALATLTDRERHIVALRFVWGQSQVQIAASIGVSQMQVSRVLRRVLAKLRDLMEAPMSACDIDGRPVSDGQER